jgi:hypothetical protein
MGCLSTGDSASLIRFEGHRSGSFVTAPRTPLAFMTPTSTYMLRPFTAVTRARIPLGSLSMLRRANQLQQRIYSPSNSRPPSNNGDCGIGCILPFPEVVMADSAGPAVTWGTCSNSFLFEQLETDRSLSKVPPAMGQYTAILKRDGDWWMARSKEVSSSMRFSWGKLLFCGGSYQRGTRNPRPSDAFAFWRQYSA